MADERTTIPARRKPTEASSLGPGRRIGTYLLRSEIASGGFGTVYRAERGHDRFALKVLHDELVHSEEALARFEREISTVARISHPNVVRVVDFGKLDDGRPYLVMELLEGRDLDQYLREHGRLRPDEAIAILEPLCSALSAAHEAGVIHRDLKASNVFLADHDGQRRVVLVDFGIAKLLDPESTDLTSSRHSVGTPACMAPEQIMGGTVSARTDIYALGSLLFQMVTGRLPFSDPSVTVMQHLHLHARRPAPSAIANVPVAVDPVVARAMDRDPARRQASATELLGELRAALGQPRAAAAPGRGLSVGVEIRLPGTALDDPDDERLSLVDDVLLALEDELNRAGFASVMAGGSSALYTMEPGEGDWCPAAARRAIIAFETLTRRLRALPELGGSLVVVRGELEQAGDRTGGAAWSISACPESVRGLGLADDAALGPVSISLDQAQRLG